MNGEAKADGWLDRLLREKPVVKVDEFPEEVVCVTGDGDGVEWRVYSPGCSACIMPDEGTLMELAESLKAEKAENAELRAKLASMREAVG